MTSAKQEIESVWLEGGSFKVYYLREAGFCFGVERAVQLAREAAKRYGIVFSVGPLIHNTQVVQLLEAEGIRVADSVDQVRSGVMIVRSHGLGPEVLQEAREKGIEIIDGTCPFVEKAQDYARLLCEEGYHPVIVGNARHPEVRALLSFAGPRAQVVGEDCSLELPDGASRVGIVAQTTERLEVFREVVAFVVSRAREVRVFNTICDSALSRRKNTRRLAELCDVVLVVGGRHSANTNQLAAVSRSVGTETHHIEVPDEIDPAWFKAKKTVGVTVGASTPIWITSAVIERLKQISQDLHE